MEKKIKIVLSFFKFQISFSSGNVEERGKKLVGLKFIFLNEGLHKFVKTTKLCKHVTQIANKIKSSIKLL